VVTHHSTKTSFQANRHYGFVSERRRLEQRTRTPRAGTIAGSPEFVIVSTIVNGQGALKRCKPDATPRRREECSGFQLRKFSEHGRLSRIASTCCRDNLVWTH
jgi:hypothetical protein